MPDIAATTSDAPPPPRPPSPDQSADFRVSETVVEHFEFNPLTFVEDTKALVLDAAGEAVDGLQEFILSEMGECHEVEQGIRNIETLLESHIEKTFVVFEKFALRNLFGIPKDLTVVLSHYQGYDFSVTEEKMSQLDSNLEVMRHKLQEALRHSQALARQHQVVDRDIRQMRPLLERLQPLHALAQERGVGSVADQLAFAIDQVHALASKSEAIQTELASARAQRTNTGIVSETPSERERYLHRMALIQMERTLGAKE